MTPVATPRPVDTSPAELLRLAAVGFVGAGLVLVAAWIGFRRWGTT